jgi:hypothetical protein
MMMLTEFGNVTPSLPFPLASGVIELMLVSLAIATLAVAAAALGRFWRRDDTVLRKSGRMLTPVRHAMPA